MKPLVEGDTTDPVVRGAKVLTYKVICLSIYHEDLRKLDEMVNALKERGHYKANRSALIRYALRLVDMDEIPKGVGL